MSRVVVLVIGFEGKSAPFSISNSTNCIIELRACRIDRLADHGQAHNSVAILRLSVHERDMYAHIFSTINHPFLRLSMLG